MEIEFDTYTYTNLLGMRSTLRHPKGTDPVLLRKLYHDLTLVPEETSWKKVKGTGKFMCSGCNKEKSTKTRFILGDNIRCTGCNTLEATHGRH